MAHAAQVPQRTASRRSKLFSKLSRSSSASDLSSPRRSVYVQESPYVEKVPAPPVRPHVMPAEPKAHEHYLKLQRDNLDGTLQDIKKVRLLRTSALQIRSMLFAAEDLPPNRKGLPSNKIRIQEDDVEDFKQQLRQMLVRTMVDSEVLDMKEKEMEEKALQNFDRMDWTCLNLDGMGKGF